MTEKEKLLERLNKYKWEMPNGCWRWLGVRSSSGSAQTKFKGRMIPVARLMMWIFYNFDIDSELYVLHKTNDGTCKYKDCINHEHLYVGTHRQNMADKITPYCHKCGSEFTPENTRYNNGNRLCVKCARERGNRYYRNKVNSQKHNQTE